MRETLVQDLRTLLGDDLVLTDTATLEQRAMDTWPLRLLQKVVGRTAVPPLCVIKPTGTDEVSRALAYLQDRRVAVVPYGGGSGVSGGAEPVPGSVVLDVGAMDRILRLDEENLTVTAQAGVFLGRLEAWLNKHGYMCGHYPQSIDVAQVGGLVATRSSGQFSTKYGNIEDLLVGLEAVLPGGEVVRVKNVPRRSVGPDLRQLWLGSEGAFGIITEVTLKIFPTPAERTLQAYAVPSVRDGLQIIQGVMREGWRPAVVRLHDAVEAQRSYDAFVQAGESILLVLSEGPAGYARLEGAGIDRIALAGGARALGPAPVAAWLKHRNDVDDFTKYLSMGILVDTIEVAAPWTAIAEIYDRAIQRLTTEVPEVLVASAHSSHSYPQGTNLYFVIGAQPPQDPAEVERVYGAIWSRVMETALAGGGTICHHHGVGKWRAPWVPAELGSAYRLLQGLKQVLDPMGQMNPGTLLPAPGAQPPAV
ncbi:MAG TPA: FAD-binding oxidoreductase [Symbiobacteriaceae bacterium]|jgi:alkyldihydroxyacetonephosphate synthase